MRKNVKEIVYYVKGMHCVSCEILIEKKILELKGVKSVEASISRGEVLVYHENGGLDIKKLNRIFKKDGYHFSDKPKEKEKKFRKKEFFAAFGAGLLIFAGFLALNRLGLSGLVNVSSKSSLLMFFVFGLMAGISSCAALIGGIILSMSKQWSDLHSDSDFVYKKFQPHLIFNAGRIISYGIFGVALGAIGNKLNLSFKLGPVLIITISIAMIFLALQMFGFKKFRKIQFTIPKSITRFIADESNFKARWAPLLMGAFTFFLPCGFTVTAQGLALVSGSATQGGLIMLLFALGTLPTLLFIGLSSVRFSKNPYSSERFLKAAGVLVLFFAFYNINSQLNVLGISSFSDLRAGFDQPATGGQSQNKEVFPPIVGGKQIIKMDASSRGYSPNYFKVRAGLPVRWEIADKGTSGCTNAIISKSLFEEEILLAPGKTSVKEFTPEKPGRYKFSCWMGMVSGIIDIVYE